ncbi:hypothetical protein Hanom_Chr00s000007g01615831 [Helianthus anomalus]
MLGLPIMVNHLKHLISTTTSRFKALYINHDIQIYIAAGEIYGGKGEWIVLQSADAYPRLIFGFQKTILLDQYTIGVLSLDAFSGTVKDTHAQRRGALQKRLVMLDRPNQKMTFMQIQKSIR